MPYSMMSKKVLIVDDIETVHAVLRGMIEATRPDVECFSVYSAESAEEFMIDDPGIDLIIMDEMMGGQTGTQCTESLRKKGFEVPILQHTAYPKLPYDDEIYNGKIPKPVSAGNMAAICKRYL